MWKSFTEPFKNCNYIFPIQQQPVLDLINECKKDSNVRKLIIFGSSVTSACNPWSDVDVYFELDSDKKLPSVKSSEIAYDKWSNFSVDENLYEEIRQKGVVVYER